MTVVHSNEGVVCRYNRCADAPLCVSVRIYSLLCCAVWCCVVLCCAVWCCVVFCCVLLCSVLAAMCSSCASFLPSSSSLPPSSLLLPCFVRTDAFMLSFSLRFSDTYLRLCDLSVVCGVHWCVVSTGVWCPLVCGVWCVVCVSFLLSPLLFIQLWLCYLKDVNVYMYTLKTTTNGGLYRHFKHLSHTHTHTHTHTTDAYVRTSSRPHPASHGTSIINLHNSITI